MLMAICTKCKKEAPLFFCQKRRDYMCAACHREYNPPFMTLIDFRENNSKMLWNLEVGDYEQFHQVEDIEWCGWMVRSTQDSLLSLMPRINVLTYHLEYFGTVACGRCIDYPFFTTEMTKCMSVGCEKLAKPFRAEAEILYPPGRSKYTKWKGMWS